PVFVDRIERADGTILWQHQHTQTRVISSDIADPITDILVDAVSGGTGRSARLPGRVAAGKTGTGTGHKDAWFVGYTPQLATAVWVGMPDAQIALVPPVTPMRVFGGGYPAQIWRAFMEPAHEGLPVEQFPDPPGDIISSPSGPGIEPLPEGDIQGGEALGPADAAVPSA